MAPATQSSFNVCFCDIDGTLVHYPESQAKWGRTPNILVIVICGVVSSLSCGVTGEITGPSVVPGCFMYVEKVRALCIAASGTRSHHILVYCVTMQETGKRHKVLKLPPTTTGLQVAGLGMTHAYRLQLSSITQASASSARTCCRASSL